MARAHSTKGFRFIERLIIISGNLEAVTIPMHMNERERAEDAAVKGDFTNYRLDPDSCALLGLGSLGLGDTDYAIRVP